MEKITVKDILSEDYATINGKSQLTIDIEWDNTKEHRKYKIDISANTNQNIDQMKLSDIEENVCIMDKDQLRGEILLSLHEFLGGNKKLLWYDLSTIKTSK